jgi:CRP-like cAMP-binding protein
MSAFEEQEITCAFFQGLSPAERQRVLSLTDRQAFSQGEVIISEGKSVQTLWILVRGRCEVLKMRKNGGSQRLAVLEPGAVFGEMSFFHPAPHSASVRALSDVEVLCLSRDDFETLQETCPPAARKIAVSIVSVLAERLRKMDEWTCELIERPDGKPHREEWREFRSKLYSDWQF